MLLKIYNITSLLQKEINHYVLNKQLMLEMYISFPMILSLIFNITKGLSSLKVILPYILIKIILIVSISYDVSL